MDGQNSFTRSAHPDHIAISIFARFFDITFQLTWPTDTLEHLFIDNQTIPIASTQALSLYRQKHQHITDAYHTYHQK